MRQLVEQVVTGRQQQLNLALPTELSPPSMSRLN